MGLKEEISKEYVLFVWIDYVMWLFQIVVIYVVVWSVRDRLIIVQFVGDLLLDLF